MKLTEGPGRLAAIEDQFAEIERLLKNLRKRIAELAENVRLSTARAKRARTFKTRGPSRSRR